MTTERTTKGTKAAARSRKKKPASLKARYDLRYLADVLIEAQRWEKSNDPAAAYQLAHAKAAAAAFGMPDRNSERPRREMDDADHLNRLVRRVAECMVSWRPSPFSSGLEGRPTAADLLATQFRDRFTACERAGTVVLDELLMAALAELVGETTTISNEDLVAHGFDPWASPPKPEDDW